MNKLLNIALLLIVTGIPVASAQSNKMTFFITSSSMNDGGNLNGLTGADRHCQKLATAVGAGSKTWHAYLSTTTVHARDRIGQGPWFNANDVMIAKDLAHLHSKENNINKQTALNEKAEVIRGRGDTPNQHDILTGTNKDGSASEFNCNNWTSNDSGSAMVGHHDKKGPANRISWNAAHESFGCSQTELIKTGGNGYLYCFALE